MANITIGAVTTGMQTVTATGAVTPTAGLSVAAVTGDFTLYLQVQAQTSGNTFQIQLEESTNAFTATVADLVVGGEGLIASAYDKIWSIRKYELPGTSIGTTGAVIRANVTELAANSTLALRAWIEY
jgi:ABC-type transport system involved in cytochrome bd biosynthesis fused ATPase/permease subunit